MTPPADRRRSCASIAAHSSDHAVTSDSKTGFFSASARANARGDHSAHITLTASNYNDRVVALRYVYVLALSIWFGGIITIGAIVAPVSDAALHRFFVTTYVAGALVLTTLFGMALLGPRPSGFFARLVVAVAMFAPHSTPASRFEACLSIPRPNRDWRPRASVLGSA